jgi:large subunit ribosomal protein L32
MAVPKKRTGHSAQGHRRSNWKATKPETTKCTNCGELALTHTVCTACGYYKGQPVKLADKALAVDTKPAKKTSKKAAEALAEEIAEVKPAKKSTKKAVVKAEEVKEEVKIESEEAQAAAATETSEEIENNEQKPQ